METKSNLTIKIVRELLDYGFSILLHNEEQLADACGGWCWIDDDENKREFAIAMKHHMSFEIILHEYCHSWSPRLGQRHAGKTFGRKIWLGSF